MTLPKSTRDQALPQANDIILNILAAVITTAGEKKFKNKGKGDESLSSHLDGPWRLITQRYPVHLLSAGCSVHNFPATRLLHSLHGLNTLRGEGEGRADSASLICAGGNGTL